MSMLNNFKKLVLGDYPDDEEFVDEFDNEEEDNDGGVEQPLVNTGKQPRNVVNLTQNTNYNTKVLVIKPLNYEDAKDIAEGIRNKKIVVVNTTSLETKVAQRLVDFISGACCVLNAQLQEIEQRVYLLSPSNVEVTSELKSELSSKAIFSWNK